MKISIIVPVYKKEPAHLKRCIESLISQTIKEKEIILVNDASPDNSLEILLEYKKQYPDLVQVIDLSQNRGPGGARNAGILASKGEFLGFVDADDFIHPDMYKTMGELAIREGADIVDCDIAHVNQDGSLIYVEISNTEDQLGELDEIKHKSLILNTGRIVTKIIQKELFVSNKIIYRENVSFEDNDLGVVLLMLAKKISKVSMPFYNYVMSDDSICRLKVDGYSINDRFIDDRLSASISIKKRFLQHNLYFKYQEEVDFVVFKLGYINTLFGTYERYKNPPYHKLKELNTLNKLVPDIKKNKYYDALDWKIKFWVNLNSIHPRLFASIFSINELTNDTIRKTVHKRRR